MELFLVVAGKRRRPWPWLWPCPCLLPPSLRAQGQGAPPKTDEEGHHRATPPPGTLSHRPVTLHSRTPELIRIREHINKGRMLLHCGTERGWTVAVSMQLDGAVRALSCCPRGRSERASEQAASEPGKSQGKADLKESVLRRAHQTIDGRKGRSSLPD